MVYVGGCEGQEVAGVEDYVYMTNGRTGVGMAQAAEPLVCLCLSGGTSAGLRLAEGKFEMSDFRTKAFHFH